MKGELLILFVFLLFGLILCSFLGSKMYSMATIEGMTNTSDAGSASIQTNSNGDDILVVTNKAGKTTTYSSTNSSLYSGPNGKTAKIVTDINGLKNAIITTPNGNIYSYKVTDTSQKNKCNNYNNYYNNYNNYDNYNHYDGNSYPSIFYGPNGCTAKLIQTPDNNTIVITYKNGTTEIYYIDNKSNNSTTYYCPSGGSAKIIKDNNGKHAIETTTSNGSKLVYYGDNIYTNDNQDDTINQYDGENNTTGSDYNTAYSSTTQYGQTGGKATSYAGPAGNTYATYDSSAYYNSLPAGISQSQIPNGDEDLYILKSQVVPPVCPKCPDPIISTTDTFDATKCPPCPPCARCPEPAFDCVKRPNYKAFNPDFMPVPVLSDFSAFGM